MQHIRNDRRAGAPRSHRDAARWSRAGTEPSLDEVIHEPMVRLLWRRDDLDPVDAMAELTDLRHLIRRRERGTHL
ncbi:MAG: hypothetical protein U1E45_11910 [Geminicoccaceae bacterium]